MKLLLRADASATIGTGHVMRGLALAQAARDDGFAVTFACAELPAQLAERIAAQGFDVVSIEAERGSDEDAARTAALAVKRGADWVALDGYVFPPPYHRRVRDAARLLVVEDLHHHAVYDADLLLNQNFGAEAIAYRGADGPLRVLAGPRHALLRSEYARWRDWHREAPKDPPRVLVSCGGSDPEGATARVLAGVAEVADRLGGVVVVVGASNPRRAELADAISRLGADAELRHDVPDMSPLLAEADLAVSAGGSTCLELAFMGLPAVVLAIADNQRDIVRALDAAGVAHSVGWHADCPPRRIAQALSRLIDAPDERARMSARGREQVDGRGAERVCAALREPSGERRG